jgi:hypothetical protein
MALAELEGGGRRITGKRRPRPSDLMGLQAMLGADVNHNFEIREVAGDGSCFFHAVAQQSSWSSAQLWELAVEVVKSRADMCSHFIIGGDVEDYVSSMKNPRAWADHHIILCLADALKRPIYIYSTNWQQIMVGDYDGQMPVRVAFHGEHYDAIVRCEWR